jgi:hypothetical protein
VGEDGWMERRWGGGRVGGVGGAVGWWGAEGLTCTAAGRAGTTTGRAGTTAGRAGNTAGRAGRAGTAAGWAGTAAGWPEAAAGWAEAAGSRAACGDRWGRGVPPQQSLVGGLPIALPLGTATVTWLGRCELQVGTATALGVCMPPSESPSLSMIFLCFPSPLFGVSRRNFEKMHPPAVISGRQTITLGLHFCLQSIDASSCRAQKKSH